MAGCVEFPGGFFLGVKDDAATTNDSNEDGEAAGGGSSSSSMLARIQQMLRDQDDVVLVDLSRNLVSSASPRLPVTFKVRTDGRGDLPSFIYPLCDGVESMALPSNPIRIHTPTSKHPHRASPPASARHCRRAGRRR